MNLDRNDIKMRTVSKQFYYNENNVTVELVCTLVTPDLFTEVFGPFYKVVKATAKCHADDKYDKTLGEKIALARAESKAYRLLTNEMKRRWNYLFETIEAVTPLRDAFYEKAENSIEHNERYVKELPSKVK